MPSRLLDYYKRLSESRQVEDSASLRWLVWGTTEVAMLALWNQHALATSVVLLSLAGVSLGSYVSHLRRHKNNWWIKLVLTAAMTYLLVTFLSEIGGSYADLRLPLASLFLWLLVLHSFDLPGRKDLLLMVVSSFILLGLASAFSLTTAFLFSILLYLLVAIPTMIVMESGRMKEGALVLEPATPAGRQGWRETARATVVACTVILLLGTGASALLPQEYHYAGVLPFSPSRIFFGSGQDGVLNPGYPDLPSHLPDSPLPVNPDAYSGIASFVDLRMRGRLSDTLLMRVKSTTPSYWRGMVFDAYLGSGWERSNDGSTSLVADWGYFRTTRGEAQAPGWTSRSVQTFYVERELPNVIYGAYRPNTVYFPSNRIEQDAYLGLRSPFLLDKGLVYSVVSDVPTPPAEALRAYPAVGTEGEFEQYLRLPEVSERLRGLVEEVTAGYEAPYDKALALQDHLKKAYDYSLVPPSQGPDEDSVDFFLFESGQGTCEHFATALAVMCRASGIPSRLVTGYATGDFNPFTGMYEVAASDAHAWVELYFKGAGWVPFEATPGFTWPDEEAGSPYYSVVETLKWLGERLSGLLPDWLRSGTAGAFRAVGGFFSGVASFGYRNPSAGVAMLLALLLPAAILLLRRRRRIRGEPALATTPREMIVADFLGFSASLARRGKGRDPSTTPREYLQSLEERASSEEAEELADTLYRARYDDRELGEFEALDFRARIRELSERLRGRD